MRVPGFLFGRRAALTALAVGVAVLVLPVAAALWYIAGGDGASSADRLHRLALLEAHAAARPQVERALAALRLQAAAQPSLLQGESDALSQAALQSDLKTLAESHGGEVRSTFAIPNTVEDGLTLVAIQYDLTVPATKLRDLVHGIESHMPYLFLSAIELSPPQSWPTDPKAPEPRIEIRWTISAYRREAAP